jgi:predicted Zn-dependent protease with MMP-like domain
LEIVARISGTGVGAGPYKRRVISLQEFADRARAAFEEIPPEFRERVAGPVIVPDARRHPEVRGVFTLGECVHAPDFAGGGELSSTVVLYYGSFVELAARDPDFDVEAEIVETVRHEVQHHVEDQVGHPGLRDLDWAEDQNERWRQGRDHRPRFWRAGEPWGAPGSGLRAVGRDVFLEVDLPESDWLRAAREGLVLRVEDDEVEIAAGELEDEEEAFEFEGLGRSEHRGPAGDLVVVVRRRRRGLLDWLRKERPA